MSTKKLVGFGDADAFCASAETVRRPWMAGLPVGVLGNQGACVIARNYPMKKFGIKVGMPVWEAKALCPDGVYVKRDFRWYESISRRMLAEIGKSSPRVEYYSIDEFFWEGIPLHGTYLRTAETIRDRMKSDVCSPLAACKPDMSLPSRATKWRWRTSMRASRRSSIVRRALSRSGNSQ